MEPKPVNPMEDFNKRFAKVKKSNGEQPVVSPKAEANSEKKEEKKKNSTNDLSQIGELLKTNSDNAKGDKDMSEKNITVEMRHKLNALGMDDVAIDKLSYDDALGILKNENESSKKPDEKTDEKKITPEMREDLNRMGMDDATINGLTYNDAAGILKDKKEINESLDNLNTLKINEGQEDVTPPVYHSVDVHWIDKKVIEYNKMKAAGNTDIKNIIPDKAAGKFVAEVDNGSITYTSENEATISHGASYKVFETMMREPSNAGKTVRIPDDSTEEFKTNLFVAAILNGHKVSGAEGLELDEKTLSKIPLTEAQKARVIAALPKEEKNERVTDVPTRDDDKPLPGPYDPVNHRINHVFERKNMLDALAKGEADSVKPNQNPAKPTFIFKKVKEYSGK